MIRSTPISRLLAGYQDIPGVDLEQVAVNLVKVSQLICDFGEIETLDINPFLCDLQGALALDARF